MSPIFLCNYGGPLDVLAPEKILEDSRGGDAARWFLVTFGHPKVTWASPERDRPKRSYELQKDSLIDWIPDRVRDDKAIGRVDDSGAGMRAIGRVDGSMREDDAHTLLPKPLNLRYD